MPECARHGDHYLRSECAVEGTVSLADLPVGTYLLIGTSGFGSRPALQFAEVAEDTVTSVELGA